MRRFTALLGGVAFSLIGATLLPANASAASPSGKAVAVIQSAEASGAGTGNRVLAVNAPVFMDDVIHTGPVGEAQLLFRDDTRLVVGPNSRLLIDTFIFNGNATAQEVSINAVRGAFRFITGKSPKPVYSIRTPTANLGVRGTEFDFSVAANGNTSFVLYEGSARLCDKSRRNCVVLTGACSVAQISPLGGVRQVNSVEDRAALLKTAFPYLWRQKGLRRDFQVNSADCRVANGSLVPRGGGGDGLPKLAPAQKVPRQRDDCGEGCRTSD